MKFWVANTDDQWANFLRVAEPSVEEVNFWQPGGQKPVTLEQGDLWVFKRKVRLGGQIVGGAWYVHWSRLTPRLAWEAFGTRNGAPTADAFYRALGAYKSRTFDPLTASIGANVLTQPFWLPADLWITSPSDWSPNLTTGKTYDSSSGAGRVLWDRLREAMRLMGAVTPMADLGGGYGAPRLIHPRIGQGAFRILVTDAYERRCAVTGERTLPVLEAAHIKPFSLVQEHQVSNGILLRVDLHRLFDLGYVTIDPDDRRLVVSRQINEQFANGKEYYALEGTKLRLPQHGYQSPSQDALQWHADKVFVG